MTEVRITNMRKCRAQDGALCDSCAGLIRFGEREYSTDHGVTWLHRWCAEKLRAGDWASAYPPPPDEVARAQRAEAGLAWLRSAGRQVR